MLWTRRYGLIVTAAPGTGSTALRDVLLRKTDAVELVRDEVEGLDRKHATVDALRAGGAEVPTATVVTATRHPQDFYLAEWWRSRTRWSAGLSDPGDWVHRTPGLAEQVRAAVALDFLPWLHFVLGDDGRKRRLVGLRFAEDRTQREIAWILGISQSNVQRRLLTVIERLRHLLDADVAPAARRTTVAVPPEVLA